MIRGEVWWVRFDPTQGNEVNKTRPAIVLSNDAANLRMGRALVVPLSNSTHTVHQTETLIEFNGGISKAMIDQMRVADSRRFNNFIGVLPESEIGKVMDVVKLYLDIV